MSYIVLSKEDRKLLLDTRKLLEELLETLDILSNLEEIKALEQSEKEMREGKLISLDDLVHELEKKRLQS
ncbi:MAG: hypothetical protein QME50_03025 [Candidatus Bathyarchaeota archaeon]|nr:hypothetical protein [Candidatus Bathyarchaeota archaeon]